MLNIELQCCGLFMLLILLRLFVQESGLRLSSRRLYLFALISSIACLTLDIVSIVGIYCEKHHLIPRILAVIICKLYVMSLAFQTYQGFLYAAGEFFAGNSHKKIRTGYLIWLIVGEAAIALLPIDFLIDGRVVYSFGMSTAATYAVTIVFIISTIVAAFRENNMTSRRRKRAILIWQFTWLLAALIQLLNPGLLLVGFATALGMMILYAELENPHEGIDRMTGLFTANALTDYVNDAFGHGVVFSSVHIHIEQNMRDPDPEKRKSFLIWLAYYLGGFKKIYAYRSKENELVLLSEKTSGFMRDYRRIADAITQECGSAFHVSFFLAPESNAFKDAQEYFRIFSYYDAEAENRGEIVINKESIDHFRDYARAKELVESALEENRVEVFYQPFYNTKTGSFTAAEALVRIRDEDGMLIPPGRFIPAAEENGLIIPLGVEIFRQVCDFLSTGKPQEMGIEVIEVNLSIAQFDDVDPTAFVTDVMERYKIDPRLINLEITETASAKAKKIILKNMQKLINLGVQFALDDFGTGRSNLDYFLEMPVDIIKFDYTFTQGYFKDEKAKTVIESTISMMHKMGMEIVSEGVETKDQFESMVALGVEYIQGFYFSKPLQEKDFISFLEGAKAT